MDSNTKATPADLTATLSELEELLATEHQALRRLDRSTLDTTTDKKLVLDARLRQLLPHLRDSNGAERATLERIRRASQQNRMLLVHARACVQGVLQIALGEFQDGYGPNGPAAERVAPQRLSLRT